eukprot:TRINITY_DN20405_c0_g1_i1.p1 TRINITY_DN20405_c0_g1~~TRINITY_DN20405_c0_g1_i1.p1  ORF type:complete len:333 (+),score=126.47 TRINITY_DN20405_c0_g1_i1:78-1076(+)
MIQILYWLLSLAGDSPMLQAVAGTMFTWAVTALGSALVFLDPLLPVSQDTKQVVLDAAYGFSGGVMLAASYWSLLAPAIELAEKTPWYANYQLWEKPDGTFVSLTWLPPAVGILAGVAFLILGDALVASYMDKQTETELARRKKNDETEWRPSPGGDAGEGEGVRLAMELRAKDRSWRRVLLLVAAVTIHNIPEGMAVGVGFGALGTETCEKLGCSYSDAVNLALGIGLQNFPEGMAVSLPLRRHGVPLWTCFFYGQLSGMVEPFAGLLGATMISTMEPLLPYALSFAAGAMIFVVVDDLIPESHQHGNVRTATFGCVVGFLTMMILDVALG